MGTFNAMSAEAVAAWNQSAATINNSKIKRDYNLKDHINNSNLDAQTKKDLLVKLTGKAKTMLEGSVALSMDPNFKDKFDDILKLINRSKNSDNLIKAEAAMQTQIDVVRGMNLPREKKALYLYTLQNMTFALGDIQITDEKGNVKENDFMPRALRDQYQWLLKSSAAGMDWDRSYESTYSTEYQDPKNPTLADWKFLDPNKIQNNMENLSRYRATGNDTINQDLRNVKEQPRYDAKDGVIKWGPTELYQTNAAEVDRIYTRVMDRFNAKNLEEHLPEFYNFVKDSLQTLHQGEEVDRRLVQEVVLSTMHKIINHQHTKTVNGQMGTTVANNQTIAEERSL